MGSKKSDDPASLTCAWLAVIRSPLASSHPPIPFIFRNLAGYRFNKGRISLVRVEIEVCSTSFAAYLYICNLVLAIDGYASTQCQTILR